MDTSEQSPFTELMTGIDDFRREMVIEIRKLKWFVVRLLVVAMSIFTGIVLAILKWL